MTDRQEVRCQLGQPPAAPGAPAGPDPPAGRAPWHDPRHRATGALRRTTRVSGRRPSRTEQQPQLASRPLTSTDGRAGRSGRSPSSRLGPPSGRPASTDQHRPSVPIQCPRAPLRSADAHLTAGHGPGAPHTDGSAENRKVGGSTSPPATEKGPLTSGNRTYPRWSKALRPFGGRPSLDDPRGQPDEITTRCVKITPIVRPRSTDRRPSGPSGPPRRPRPSGCQQREYQRERRVFDELRVGPWRRRHTHLVLPLAPMCGRSGNASALSALHVHLRPVNAAAVAPPTGGR